ncbi:hypothetical protein EUX98_g8812 [Antrodiella citrinella]|uniref:NADH-ubiquinone oxidoreductase 14.8 kDa subunit n=1 Tax=Antrodiella citrinella TaxID=2447956 RepID=A0A4S4M2C2_9APHY|nr:hypothetical protein EUX98_g8812 [Antrodiella citrinella]
MSTIPARLARAAQVSTNHAEARARVFKLYRDWYRGTPEIISVYALNISPAFFRHAIRQHFEENRYVTDLKTIDILLQKSRIEYQETINCWKTTDHVLGVLLRPKGRPQRSFLEKFYEAQNGGYKSDQFLMDTVASGVDLGFYIVDNVTNYSHKKYDEPKEINQNRGLVFGDAAHLIFADPARRLRSDIENTSMRLWFLSRTVCFVTELFTFIAIHAY